jgi:UDP-N-acetyl-D-mannosaminuronic acid transferase (WecB/TagA/CpsF family)
LLQDYKQKSLEQVRKAYQDTIQDADLVLPDGIALQIFYFLAKKKRLSNLNGTDFAPYLLQALVKKSGRDNVRVVLYGTYPDLLAKTKVFLEKK